MSALAARLERLEAVERAARRRGHAERVADRLGCDVDELIREADALAAEITAALGPDASLDASINWLAAHRGLDPTELRAAAERAADEDDG